MTLDEYQEGAVQTAIYPAQFGIQYTTLGLVNEAGEVAGVVKKMYRDSNGKMTEEVASKIHAELGDVLWYVAMLASEIGFTLSGIANGNLLKLQSRQDRGVLGGSGDNR